jgi:hypothetical protein
MSFISMPGDTDRMRGFSRGEEVFLRAEDALSSRRIPECLALLERAEALKYDADACAGCRWYCWMLLGRFEEAWRESNAIAARGKPDPHRLWDGKPFSRRQVIIRCLHGFGDAIQFLRYAPVIRREASRVIVQTHPQLVQLLRGITSVDEVVTWNGVTAAPAWDQQIEVMELARAFRATPDNVPRDVPYLSVAGEHLARSRRMLGPNRHPRVGLMWEGGEWDTARNIPFPDLRPILATNGVEFFSFQRGGGRSDLPKHRFASHVRDFSGDSPEVTYFAADLANMDLLITVDTMAAHLAGALARPVWLLLPFAADWRWMLDRCDSPWYPTMRLYRQARPGDWSQPIAEIAQSLAEFAHSRR